MRPRAWLVASISSILVSAAAALSAGDALFPLDVRQVTVGGEMGRRIDVTVANNLLALNVDKDFLMPFQQRNRQEGYIGLGKLLDAAVRFAAYTGDQRVVKLKQHLATEAIRTQEADGYIGLVTPEARVSALWDVHEMSYLVYGLTMDHRFFGQQTSLAAARKLADYLIAHWPTDPKKLPGGGALTLHMAVTGLENAMLALHQETLDPRYLEFCTGTRQLAEWDARIVTGRFGQIEGHAYAHLCRCIAQLRLHRLEPDPRLLKPSREVLDFLTRHDGLVISGECGDHECWHDTQEGTINLGESCATAYLTRFLDEWLRLEANSRYGDLLERTIYNGMFGAQSPDGRKIRYYTPFDGPRGYFEGDTYCCPCNLRRIIAELPGLIYYRAEDGLTVNLYTPSKATLELAEGLSVKVRQETDYPNSGHVELVLEPSQPAEFHLRLRLPRWCHRPAVAVNGQAITEGLEPGKFVAIKRPWKSGDRVTLELPMTWRLVKGKQNQGGHVAVMRGPQVFSLNRARHPLLATIDLRLLVLDPASVEGPLRDDSVRPGGQACRVRAWRPGAWYPQGKTDFELTLTEYADPGAEATYFKVPNPKAEQFVEDELFAP